MKEIDFIKRFPLLEHPEHHFNKYPDHPWLKTKEEIFDWLSENDRSFTSPNNYTIHRDLTVSVHTKKLDISNKNIEFIPIQFRSCFDFDIHDNKIQNLLGSPYKCNNLNATNNLINTFEYINQNTQYINITSFESMPHFSNDKTILNVLYNPIKSWKGFTKIRALHFWQQEWCDETSYNLLLQSPNTINTIILKTSFNHPSIIRDEFSMDMKWLRREQEKIKSIKTSNEKIEATLTSSITNTRKRKL